MYKTRRQQRYEKLRNNGLLPREAQVLSKVPLNVPYIKKLITDRRQFVKKQLDNKKTPNQIEQMIRSDYYGRGMIVRDSLGRPKLNVWGYLRKYEDEYKGKQPEYRSPSQKRYKKFVDFQRKFENMADDVQLK